MKHVFYCSHVISNTFFISRKKKEKTKCEYNPSLLTSVYILITITSCHAQNLMLGRWPSE